MCSYRPPRYGRRTGTSDPWGLGTAAGPGRSAASPLGVGLTIGLLNLGAVAVIIAISVADPFWGVLAGLIHAVLVPGAMLALLLLPSDEVEPAEWLILAVGLGTISLIVGGVVLALLPLRFSAMTVVGWSATVALSLSGLGFRRALRWRLPTSPDRTALADAGLVALVALATRLPGLGYSELQGDETEVILRALGVVQALPDALFYHGKGPGEVVVVAMLYGLVGAISEGAARLPFALAGVVGIVGFALLVRRLLGRPAGLAAGLLLAASGYVVAFSRIAQYQTLVLLLGTLALFCAVRWSHAGSRVWPALAGAFAASAALAHYDAAFVLPPIALALLWRAGWRGLADRAVLLPWLTGAGVGLAILLLFFLPYLTSPLFGLATDRISDRVGAGFPHNNVPSIVQSAALYLGPAFPIVVGLLGAVGVWAVCTARVPSARRVGLLALVWAAVPILFYAFVARKPGTHIHVAGTGLVLLAAVGFASAWAALCQRPARLALGGLLGVGLLLTAGYLVPVYLQTTAEIVRENRVGGLPLAWTPPGGYPPKERFGFPYQAGWKAIGTLYADGTLAGSYETNEQPQVSHWYTRGAWRCSASPRYFLIAEDVQDEIETPRRVIQSEYRQIGAVTVAGEPKLRVYERGTARGPTPVTWSAESMAGRFDRPLSAPTLDPGLWARGVVPPAGTTVSARFGQAVDLLGVQVLAEDPRPGGVVRVDLAWLPRVTSDNGHRIDVQLGDAPRIGDGGGPGCDKTGAERDWRAGRPFVQRVSIPIAAAAAPGSYPLLVGVSDLGAGGPLAPTIHGAAVGTLVEVGRVEVAGGSRDGR